MSDTNSGPVLVLEDAGTWYYRLPAERAYSGPATYLADDTEMIPARRRGWLSAGHDAATLSVQVPQPPRTLGYRLKDPTAASERYPLEMSAEEWRRAVPDTDSAAEWALYNRIAEEAPARTVVFDGPRIRLDGAPAPDDGRTWVAELPHELTRHSELLHLFPGYMPGLTDAAKSLVKRMRGVTYCLDGKQPGHLDITLSVPYDPPRSQWRPNLGRRGQDLRTGHTVPVDYRRQLSLAVPDRIAAANRAAAAARWDKVLADLAETISVAASLRACGHCDGTGVVGGDQ